MNTARNISSVCGSPAVYLFGRALARCVCLHRGCACALYLLHLRHASLPGVYSQTPVSSDFLYTCATVWFLMDGGSGRQRAARHTAATALPYPFLPWADLFLL